MKTHGPYIMSVYFHLQQWKRTFSLRQGLSHWPGICWFSKPEQQVQDFFHLCLPSTEILSEYHHSWLNIPSGGFWSFCLYGKHFTNWSIYPAPGGTPSIQPLEEPLSGYFVHYSCLKQALPSPCQQGWYFQMVFVVALPSNILSSNVSQVCPWWMQTMIPCVVRASWDSGGTFLVSSAPGPHFLVWSTVYENVIFCATFHAPWLPGIVYSGWMLTQNLIYPIPSAYQATVTLKRIWQRLPPLAEQK